jgi:hypothetical protein
MMLNASFIYVILIVLKNTCARVNVNARVEERTDYCFFCRLVWQNEKNYYIQHVNYSFFARAAYYFLLLYVCPERQSVLHLMTFQKSS